MSIDPLSRIVLSGPTMGTRWSAVFYARASADDLNLNAALQAAVDDVDATMSTWKPESDLMRVNRTPPGLWLDVSPSLCAIVALGLEIGTQSHGAFDIGVGANVAAWGFGALGSQPDVEALAQPSIQREGTRAIEVDLSGCRIRRTAPVQIDLSGIAKGYGVDCLSDTMMEHGVADFIVSIDGEVRARGTRPDGSGWAVGLERADRDQRALAHTIEVSDVAIATSGDYRHFRSHGDTIVSHTIDPRTGVPLDNGVCAVTVTAEHCAIADAWATALMVLGEDEGPALARQLGLDALFTLRRHDTLQEIGVGAFAPA